MYNVIIISSCKFCFDDYPKFEIAEQHFWSAKKLVYREAKGVVISVFLLYEMQVMFCLFHLFRQKIKKGSISIERNLVISSFLLPPCSKTVGLPYLAACFMPANYFPAR